MSKPVSLRRKINLPLLVTIIVIPLLTFIVFNLAAGYHTQKVATDDLKDIIEFSKDREAILESLTNNNLGVLGNYTLAIRATKYNSDIEYAILDRHFDIFENNYVKATLPANVFESIKPELADMSEGEIKHIKYNGTKYVFTYLKLGRARLMANVLMVSNTSFANSFISLVNKVILSTAVLALLLALLIVNYLNKGVTQPISELCNYTQRIGKRDFVEVPLNKSFKEMYELTENMGNMSLQLKQSIESQNNFIQNASHEIRTPLMSIQSYAEGLQTGVFTDINHATTIINDECKRLTKLVNELLLLSKIENYSYINEIEEINLSNALLEYAQSLNGIAIKNNIDLNLNIKDKSVFVRANDTLLTQVVYNIVTNSIRYAKSQVKVILTTANGQAVLKITDDGPGFNEQDLEHVFKRFYKGSKGKFGLGLAIAKSAIDFMKGTIQANNTDNGAEFIITLPLSL